MGRFRILPYKMNSLSSKTLSKHFNVLRIRKDGDFVTRDEDVILNWGTGGYVPVLHRNDSDFTVLNSPEAIDRATSKISTLKALKIAEIPTVEFAFTKDAASRWIEEEESLVYCRTLISSKAGKGIVLASTVDELPDTCKLFTKKFKNDEEYRIHVFNGKVIDRVHKKKMSTERKAALGLREEDLSSDIKNLKKGWSFCREDLIVHEGLDQLAIGAITALGLDFGGVDIARNADTGDMVILECNTACGQRRPTSTHMRYVAAISEYLGMDFSTEEYNTRYNCNLKFGLLNDIETQQGDNPDSED